MLVDILDQEAKGAKLKLGLAALFPGIVDAALFGVLQVGLQAGGVPSPQIFLVFCLLCILQMVCLRQSVKICASVTETALYHMRSRLGDKLRRAEAQGLEKIGGAAIHDRITQATTTISNSVWVIVDMAQSAVLLLCILLRLLSISVAAFGLTLILYGGGGVVFYLRRRKVRAIMIEAQATQLGLFSFLTALLDGGKELRLRARRGDELLGDLEHMATSLQAAPIQINRILQSNFIIARMLLFWLLATLVFVLPQLISTDATLLSALVASAIFLFEPLAALLRGLPEYERADLAAIRIQALEARLDQAALAPPQETQDPFAGQFAVIEADKLCFSYTEQSGEGFSLGPISLSLRAGEIVFFVGGNGSGKTTLLKLLTGLYPPTSGTLRVDHHVVEAANLQAYRELIAAIFTDFHLFKRLYGLSDRTAEQISRLLEQLQIAHKTGHGPEGFTNLELSTGQRKRLAMVVALLEDRPLYVFDEWAAGQDPEFRQYYYEELLPELKRRGKTVLAISHDDRYFHCADRVVFMEHGAVRSIDSHVAS
jgi:putative pyoverdin transport system ATP-binding/permease protein